MSKYTTEVRFICENSAGLKESVGYSSIDTVLDGAREKVFDFDYPIFDEAYRATLEKKILKHYYTREICCETVGLWKLFLNRKMNEIMPYYNQLYKSALIEFNPLYDVDLTIDHHRTNDGENESNRAVNEIGKYNENSSDATSENSTGNRIENDVYGENKNKTNKNITNEDTTKSDNTATNQSTSQTTHSETSNESANKNDRWEYFSDTPEGGINGVDSLNYLTNATHITDDGTGTTSGSETDGRVNGTTETLNNGESVGNKKSVSTEEGIDTTSSDRVKTGEDNKNITKDSATSTAGDNSKDINESNSETIKNIEEYLEHVVGKRGSVSYSKMLEEFRKTFLNIDMLIINDLRDLFMNLW